MKVRQNNRRKFQGEFVLFWPVSFHQRQHVNQGSHFSTNNANVHVGGTSKPRHRINMIRGKQSHIFACTLLTNNHMIYLVHFGKISAHKIFSDYKLHLLYSLIQCGQTLKKLFMLIYPKLHSKPCDYLYKHLRLIFFSSGAQDFMSIFSFGNVSDIHNRHNDSYNDLLLTMIDLHKLSCELALCSCGRVRNQLFEIFILGQHQQNI